MVRGEHPLHRQSDPRPHPRDRTASTAGHFRRAKIDLVSKVKS